MKPYFETDKGRLYEGHILEVLKQMESESVHCIITSPPYWGLRDYGLNPVIWDDSGNCDHIWGNMLPQAKDSHKDTNFADRACPKGGGHKVTEIAETHRPDNSGQFCQKCGAWKGSLGLEPTPELFVKHITDIFREVPRILKPDGMLWLNLGDSYAQEGGKTPGQPRHWSDRKKGDPGGMHDKRSLASEIGLKPKDLIGIPWMVAFALRSDGWYLRSDIIWHKPNPMPESVKDRPTKSHEYLFLLSKSAKYYYDTEAIKEDSFYPLDNRKERSWKTPDGWDTSKDEGGHGNFHKKGREKGQKRYPIDKIAGIREGSMLYPKRNKRTVWTIATQPFTGPHFATFPEKLIEPCILAGCPRGGIVLDPFAGSGTTCFVSERLGRKWIGIDMDCSIGKERIENETKQRRLF